VGPVGVERDRQGQGIGGALLSAACARLDAAGAAAYLETDKAVNVAFYRRFGFETTGEAEVLGLPNWFMTRPAR
jgi:predicted N-acetyltransferase YhbS